jgi:hypothetical protein
MVERGRLFDTPTFRWIPARSEVPVKYQIVALQTDRVPDELSRQST